MTKQEKELYPELSEYDENYIEDCIEFVCGFGAEREEVLPCLAPDFEKRGVAKKTKPV